MTVHLTHRAHHRRHRKVVPSLSCRVPHESRVTDVELDKRGRATDVPVPLDLTSLKFLGKLALVVPLLAALAAHLAEPGLLTKDKSKDQ